MPEGDSVHTIASALGSRLVGQTVRRVDVEHSSKTWLAGARITEVGAVDKHLLITIRARMNGEPQEDCIVRSHLGLHGSWHRYAPDERCQRPQWQASLGIETKRDVFVCFHARQVALVSSLKVKLHRALTRLGPDRLSESIDWSAVLARARRLAAYDVAPRFSSRAWKIPAPRIGAPRASRRSSTREARTSLTLPRSSWNDGSALPRIHSCGINDVATLWSCSWWPDCSPVGAHRVGRPRSWDGKARIG